MNNQQQVNNIAKKFSKILIESGLKILKSAFRLQPIVYSKGQIFNFLYDLGFINVLSLYDEKYYIVDWETWESLIEVDWTEEKSWYEDYYDCDNHGFTFSSRIAEIFDLNSCAVCGGNVYNKDTGNLIGGHVFNLIIAVENGQLTAYLFEPMKAKYIKWQKGQKNTIDNWEYRINWISIF